MDKPHAEEQKILGKCVCIELMLRIEDIEVILRLGFRQLLYEDRCSCDPVKNTLTLRSVIFSTMSSADVAVSSAAADAVMDTATILTDDSDWDVVTATQTLQYEEDAANDFLHLSEATTEELSAKLQASMASLAETIAQLQVSSKDSAADTMEVEPEPRAPALSEPVASPAPAPLGFVRASQPPLTLSPIRFVLDPENNAFSKLAAFLDSFPSIPNYLIQLLQHTSEAEIADLFAKFVHVPMTAQGVRITQLVATSDRPLVAPLAMASSVGQGFPLATCCPDLRTPGSRCPWPGGTGAPHATVAQSLSWPTMGPVEGRRYKSTPQDQDPAQGLAISSCRTTTGMVDQQSGHLRHGKCSTLLGRLAAWVFRLLYQLFPQVDWGFVFVDDYRWILRADTAPLAATTLLLTLLSLGIPFSWKKTHLAEVNTWLGFVVHPNTPQVQMAAPKHVLVMVLLDRLIQGDSLTHKEIEKALGRVQWATAVKLPIGSDNQGNVFALLNQASKKPYTAAVLMELVLRLHTTGCALAPCHVPRELNEWADELTHPGFEGFDVQRRLDVSGLPTDFVILPRLMNSDSLGFTEQATRGQGRTVVAAENFDLAHHTVTG
eukprot:s3535_g6.t1